MNSLIGDKDHQGPQWRFNLMKEGLKRGYIDRKKLQRILRRLRELQRVSEGLGRTWEGRNGQKSRWFKIPHEFL